MAAKCFIDGTFFAPMCSLSVKLNFIYFLCFTLFLLLFLQPLDVALISLLV